MDLATANQIIDTFLHTQVGATGTSGFEGLVAVLVQEATGEEFRLSSSGRQSGRDAGSESGFANSIKVETKHYLRTNPLDLRELLSEIAEATASDPNLDIWVLAASRSVDDQIQTSLDKEAESRGIDVLILDFGINGLHGLGVLMSAFPAVVRAWAARHHPKYDANELEGALLTIAREPGFESAQNRLLVKLNCLIGYDAARRRIHEHLLRTLSDANNARATFRQSLSIRAPGAQFVLRTQLKRALDTWWDVQGVPQSAVVLGEEGTGKTWAVFDWALGRVESGGMPILLPLAAVAHEVTNGDLLEIILPKLLARWTGVLDEKRWKRRLDRWVSSSSTCRPLILLIVDGLNERADLDWRPLLATAQSDPWRRNIAVLATDRPHHWRTKCSRAGLSTFDEITVGGYSQPQLDCALSTMGLSLKDIPDGLLPLISIPRYCGLVARHYQEMVAACDFTPERLIYLEVRDRQSAKLQYPLTDEQVFGTIRDLARHARVNPELKPSDLMPLVAVPGGDAATIYEELISGGLLVPISANGMTEGYRVEPLRLVYGFGMLLAEELRQKAWTNTSQVEEFITSWFEPQPDMDRKVDICASAMFHALFQEDFPEQALRELIRYWLSLRNWADTAQSAFAAYILRRPKVFLEIAEDFWSSARDSGAAQEFLREAFAAYRDDTRLQPLLISAVERWMGFIHPLGRRYWTFDMERTRLSRKAVEAITGQAVLPLAGETGEEGRARQEIESRAGCAVVPGEIEVSGVKLTVVSDGALLRLARFGLMVMSAGDPSPFVGSLTHWAVASAVMGDSEFSDVVSWVIRLSEREVDSIVTAHARALLGRNKVTASAAARILLLAVGTKESESLIEEHNLTPEWYRERVAQHAIDPCKSLFEWTESECLCCLEREDVPLHMILDRAVLPIIDPSITLPPTLIRRADDALRTIDPARIRTALSRTIEDHNLGTLRQILCARAPSQLADFLRCVVRTMPGRELSGQYCIAVQLPEISPLLGTDEVNAVSRAIASLSTNASEWSLELRNGTRQTQQSAEARAFSGIAPHLSPSELFKELIARPSSALDLLGLELWFAPISEEAGREASTLLHMPSDQTTLYRVLWALPRLGLPLSEHDRDRLVDLFTSDDQRTRSGAIRVAVVSGDEALGRRMVELDASASAGIDPWEEHWVTLLLARFGSHLLFEDIAKRLRPSTIGFVIGERGNRQDEVDVYTACLDREWRRIVSAGDPGIERLPEVTTEDYASDSGVQFPQLVEPEGSRTVRLDRSNSWTSGPPTDPGLELKEFFSIDYEAQVHKLNEDRRRNTDAILAAWRTEAFQWYGRAFSFDAMDLVYQRHAARVDQWVEPALADSPSGLEVRVRLGGFLEPICRVLLTRNPRLGLRLWQALRSRDSNPIVFDTTDIAFGADSSESKLACNAVLDDCWNDTAIAKLALACGKWQRRDWLEETVSELISAERLWKRAKGLTLASFSDITPDRFEELVASAAVEHTWVQQSLRPLRENVRKNHLARYWYRIFLTSEDSDAAWGALQIVLAHADGRLLNWCEEVEKECASGELTENRLRFLGLAWHTRRDLRKEVDRDKERQERLFGLKIQPGEIAPFMAS
jgi:hypothetical protein